MRSAGFFFLGVFVGTVGTILGRRIIKVVESEYPDRVLEDISRQVEALDKRYGAAKS